MQWLWKIPKPENLDYRQNHPIKVDSKPVSLSIVLPFEGAQLAALLRSEGAHAERIVSILKYDGLQFTVGELVAALLREEEAR